MEDTGEKIVFLAREILNADAAQNTFKKKPLTVTMDFRTLCLTTFLAAAGGALGALYVHEDSRPLNRYEKTEIEALVFYAAKLKGIDEAALRHEVETQTGIAHLDDMTANEFPAARKYLQEKAQ